MYQNSYGLTPQQLHSFFMPFGRLIKSRCRRMIFVMPACACLLFTTLFPGTAAAAEETVYVEVLVARVRQAPTTESPILFRVRRGDPVTVKEKKGDWYRILHPNGRIGWAHQKLFTASAQNSRQAAGQGYFIKSVSVEALSAEKEAVSFVLDGFHPPETFVLKEEPPRVVCDFLNTRIREEIGNRIESKGTLIKDIRIAPYGGIAPRVRIVLDLSAGRHYEIDQTFYKKENLYIVTVNATTP